MELKNYFQVTQVKLVKNRKKQIFCAILCVYYVNQVHCSVLGSKHSATVMVQTCPFSLNHDLNKQTSITSITVWLY